MQLILHIKTPPGRPCDRRTLATILPDIERPTGAPLWRIFINRGYKGRNAATEHKAKEIWTG